MRHVRLTVSLFESLRREKGYERCRKEGIQDARTISRNFAPMWIYGERQTAQRTGDDEGPDSFVISDGRITARTRTRRRCNRWPRFRDTRCRTPYSRQAHHPVGPEPFALSLSLSGGLIDRRWHRARCTIDYTSSSGSGSTWCLRLGQQCVCARRPYALSPTPFARAHVYRRASRPPIRIPPIWTTSLWKIRAKNWQSSRTRFSGYRVNATNDAREFYSRLNET